ncbi:MAG: methyltransferase dimerization domain-containing protein [Nitrospira sp.]|nr:methyltransferase dimerization domain-containing protein [Nitrospira sp.]
MNATPNPSSILQTAFGFWGSKVLLTAVEVGLFTTLANRRLTGTGLGKELQFHPRANPDFFDALVAMKFLDREGNGPEAKYFNTPEGAMFLDAASPRYIGGILVMLNARLFKLRTASRNDVFVRSRNIFQPVRPFRTVEELRHALLAWLVTCNEQWLVERRGFRTPPQVDGDLMATSTTSRRTIVERCEPGGGSNMTIPVSKQLGVVQGTTALRYFPG